MKDGRVKPVVTSPNLGVEQLRVLLTIAGRINTTEDLKEPLEDALQMALEATGGNEGSIMLVNHDGRLRIYASCGIAEEIVRAVNEAGISIGDRIAGQVARENQPRLLNRSDEAFTALMARPEITSAISVPISDAQRVIGVLNVNRTDSDIPFKEDDLEMLVQVAGELHPVIGKRRSLEAIYEASVALAAAKTINQAIFAMQVMQRQLLIHEISLVTIDQEKDGQSVVEVTNTSTGDSRFSIPMTNDPTTSVLIQALQAKKTIVHNQSGGNLLGSMSQEGKEGPSQNSFAVVPLINEDASVGGIVIYGHKNCSISQEEVTVIEIFARIVALQMTHLRDIEQKSRAQRQMTFTLAAALEQKNAYTAGHSDRVATYAEAIGRQIGLGEKELDVLIQGARIHDIGKMGIGDDILDKPGMLSDDEWVIVKGHPQCGFNILELSFGQGVARFALRHHERPDGNGYPNKVPAEDLTRPELILGTADSFDAMTSSRAYRDEMTIEVAILEMIRCAGSQFNIDVVKALVEASKEGIKVKEDGDSKMMQLGTKECQFISEALLHRAKPDADPKNRDEIDTALATQFATIFPMVSTI